jgi:hypothetical protein
MAARVPFAERHLDTLDLLSITDVVAGALNQYLSQGKTMPAAAISVKEGSDRVLQWLAGDGFGLKKMVVKVTEGPEGTINGGTLEFTPTIPQGHQTRIGINPGPARKRGHADQIT